MATRPFQPPSTPSAMHFHCRGTSSSPPAAVSKTLEMMPFAMVMLPVGARTSHVMRLARLLKPTMAVTSYSASLSAGATLASSAPSLKALITARSMGSSFLSGLEQRRAKSMSSSTVRAKAPVLVAGASQHASVRMVMFAVVSVPVLSEQRICIAAMSCKAETDVTMAPCSLAMRAAPSAMVTWSTKGSAMGTEAMMIERQTRMTSRTSCANWWRM
mmetsp:Transcript_19765/g.68064  ORF Transcript_19765/g.68064 Transcript_19765/m.68064 type:complete len:216 (+) Transcript_19765:100-747(+)